MAKPNTSYIEVCGRLRADILSRRYPPASKLPPERQLSEQAGVSRVTVRRALRVLEQERLVQRRQGSGTYVSPTPSRRIPLMIDYTGSMREHAPALKRHLLLQRHQPAAAFEAEALHIEQGDDILYFERADRLEETTIACDQAFLADRFSQHLHKDDLTHVDFIETWSRREHFTIAECLQTTEAIAATTKLSGQLNIRRGRPILKSTEIYFATTGQPAGLFLSYYDPARVCLSSRYRWQDKQG